MKDSKLLIGVLVMVIAVSLFYNFQNYKKKQELAKVDPAKVPVV